MTGNRSDVEFIQSRSLADRSNRKGKGLNLADQQMVLLLDDDDPTSREARVSRWNTLVRVTLPSMAKPNLWPISLDHCFMRVCLDTALGGPWHLSVKRPAIKYLTDDQLEAAIAVGEGLVARPQMLAALNSASIAWRKATKSR